MSIFATKFMQVDAITLRESGIREDATTIHSNNYNTSSTYY